MLRLPRGAPQKRVTQLSSKRSFGVEKEFEFGSTMSITKVWKVPHFEGCGPSKKRLVLAVLCLSRSPLQRSSPMAPLGVREESSSRRTAEASTLQRVDVENRPLGFKVGTFERGFLCSFIFIDLFIIWHIFLWKHVQYNAFLPVSNSCCCRGNIWTIHRGSVVEFPCRVLGGHAGKHTYIFSLHSEGDANA